MPAASTEDTTYINPSSSGTTRANTGLFYNANPEDINPELLNQWVASANPRNLVGNNRDTLTSALYRYSGYERPGKYMSSQRSEDKAALEAAGLLVNGQLGARSLERRPGEIDLRYTGGEYRGLSAENANALFQQKQNTIYSDLLNQPRRRAAPNVGEPSYEAGLTQTTPIGGGIQRTRGPVSAGSIRERRRAISRAGGPVSLRRQRTLRSLQAVPQTPEGQTAPSNRAYMYDPYRETFYEWGTELGGTDKGGNTWSVADLGIQY